MLSSASSNISSNGSYSNDKEIEIAVDAASGGFFFADFKKHEDLKEMLDSNKDSLKLEAMRRIIGMVAKGRDASVLFPSVVKNVVSKNIEVKKLVYVYLERYAEEKQDLALLSIATFQRALKEPNPLIRAGALRVLSSIRVKMISPIVMLAIRDASSDMSSYVRKTAAHSILKLYSLDPELKSELICVIQKLLSDKTVLVVASAVTAFIEVCPEREDLLHQVYRKLCTLLVDIDEWGQVTILNMLTRYVRTQFVDPNPVDTAYDGVTDISNSSSSPELDKPIVTLDPDHRLLLRSARPLLQSRNAAVVMAVSQLYYHAAPKSEMQIVAKALVRLLRNHVEVQSIVLNTIKSITLNHKHLFEVYLKNFFVRDFDPTDIKIIKLDILTNLISEYNVSAVLREFQTYISNNDKKFVAATIQAIGRCACTISAVTDSCLNGLVLLLSNKDEAVVAESVVVIKRLLQTQTTDLHDIITHMAKLLDSITVAQARAAIIWLIGEHSQKVSKIAPDVLRKLCLSFTDENDIVKLQIMNLAIKLYLTNPEETTDICIYVSNLAKYDQNYDLRDKARLLKQFIPSTKGRFTTQSARIFLASKPAPLIHIESKDQKEFQLGSLSHYIGAHAAGYKSLPDFPTEAPPCELRNTDPPEPLDNSSNKNVDKSKRKSFSWISTEDSASSSTETSSADSDEEENSKEETSEAEDDSERKSEKEETSSSSSSSSEEFSSSELSSDEDSPKLSDDIKKDEPIKDNNKSTILSNFDLLTTNISLASTVMVPQTNEKQTADIPSNWGSEICLAQAVFFNTKSIDLLNAASGSGLSATYRFTRTPHLLYPSMVNINILFHNTTANPITDLRIAKKIMSSALRFCEFETIKMLSPNSSLSATMGIDFNDSVQGANFDIISSLGTSSVTIEPHIGELMKPVTMSKEVFLRKQGEFKGMNEHSRSINTNFESIDTKVLEHFNLGRCNFENDTLRFAGQTLSCSHLCLVTILKTAEVCITVNCAYVVFGSILLEKLIKCLE